MPPGGFGMTAERVGARPDFPGRQRTSHKLHSPSVSGQPPFAGTGLIGVRPSICKRERPIESPNEMRLKIVGRATEDPDFRARLLSDPKGTIGQELNVTIPASLSIEVHEENATTAHLVLPPSSRLSESALQEVIASARLDPVLSEVEKWIRSW